MSALEEPEPLHRRSAPVPEGARLEHAAWWAVVLHAFSICLHTVPWYHPGYRMPVQLANGMLLVVSALAIVLVLIPACVRRRQWGRLLVALSAGLLLFVGTTQAHAWRVAWTDHLIQAHHCHDGTQASGSYVLGGLMRTGGQGAGDGAAFINSTHCLIVVCQEEFFQCLRPPSAVDRQRP